MNKWMNNWKKRINNLKNEWITEKWMRKWMNHFKKMDEELHGKPQFCCCHNKSLSCHFQELQFFMSSIKRI